jgi:hypothetical protein
MKMAKIINLAEKAGIDGIANMGKVELIRAIQTKEGNRPCFSTGIAVGAKITSESTDIINCAEVNCCWREDCLGK